MQEDAFTNNSIILSEGVIIEEDDENLEDDQDVEEEECDSTIVSEKQYLQNYQSNPEG